MVSISNRVAFLGKNTGRRRPPRIKISKNYLQEERAAYLFLLPNLIGVLLLVVLPILASFALSFTEWNPALGLNGIEFVGMENFEDMIKDDRVWDSLTNNLIYTILYVPCSIFIGVVLAALLNHYVYAKKLFRLMIFMPYISSIVSVAVVWKVLLYPTGGPVNAILTGVFGIANPPEWFISTKWALPSITIMSIWHDMGYYMIILLAGMQNIPADVYEAADLDGASPIRKFFRITIPMLTPTLFYAMILATISSFKVFDQINVITGGGPVRATSVLVYCIYYYAFKVQKMGYASAIALLLFLIIFVLSCLQMKLRDRFSY